MWIQQTTSNLQDQGSRQQLQEQQQGGK